MTTEDARDDDFLLSEDELDSQEHILSEYRDMMPGGIDSLISAVRQRHPFLELSDMDRLRALCVTMIDEDFCSFRKPTAIRASFQFLRDLDSLKDRASGRQPFTERDFVFAIKMFGLRVRSANGVFQFLPDNKLDLAEDVPVSLDNAEDARRLEFYLSPQQTLTRAQAQQVESAHTKLIRNWKETEIARVFGRMVTDDKMRVGEARDLLRTPEGGRVKDHVFGRVRAIAIRRRWYCPKRSTDGELRRVTLDKDNADFVGKVILSEPRRGEPLTMTEMVNRMLRDFRRVAAVGASAGTNLGEKDSSAV